MASLIDTTPLEVIHLADGRKVYVRDAADSKLQTIFDTWWKGMNVESKKLISWDGRKCSTAWRFYKQCGIVQDGSPSIICIVCSQVLKHPSRVGTSGMSKHLLSKEHMAKKNKLKEEEDDEYISLDADEQLLAILKKKGSHGTLVVSY